MVNFLRGKNTDSKKGAISSKVASTSNSNEYVYQIRLSNESDILLTTFGSLEITQDETKEVVHQGEFINFQSLFQHKYYASNNTHFPVLLLCFWQHTSSRIIIKLLTTRIPDNENDLVCCHIHHKREMVKGYLISWPSIHVKPTWEIWRSCLQTSYVKRNRRLSYTRNIGLKSSVQSWKRKLITAGSIISSLSAPSNEQVSEYIYFGFYIN